MRVASLSPSSDSTVYFPLASKVLFPVAAVTGNKPEKHARSRSSYVHIHTTIYYHKKHSHDVLFFMFGYEKSNEKAAFVLKYSDISLISCFW